MIEARHGPEFGIGEVYKGWQAGVGGGYPPAGARGCGFGGRPGTKRYFGRVGTAGINAAIVTASAAAIDAQSIGRRRGNDGRQRGNDATRTRRGRHARQCLVSLLPYTHPDAAGMRRDAATTGQAFIDGRYTAGTKKPRRVLVHRGWLVVGVG